MAHHRVGFFALALLCLFPVTAAAVSFDPDGPGPAASETFTGFTYAPGNGLLQGSVPVSAGATVQFLYQSSVSAVLNGGGSPVAPSGLNSAFEITTVASTTMLVQSVVGNTVTLGVSPVQAPTSFIEFWFDTTPDANALAGTGYNDGTRILLGFPSPPTSGTSSYTVPAPAGVQFDQFGANDYGGVLSVVASGNASISFAIVLSDPAFFSALPATLTLNEVLAAPFTLTDPSHLFAGLAGGIPPGVIPVIGAVNGLSGPDFQLQVGATSLFATPRAVPESSPAAVLFVGVVGLVIALRTGVGLSGRLSNTR